MKNKIDKWCVINLNSSTYKWATQQLVAALQGIPMDIFERFPARCENDSLPSQEELARRVAADGFPEWEETFATRPVPEEYRDRPERTVQHIACEWSRMSLIRHISDSGYRVVMVSDNLYLRIRFEELVATLNQLPDDLHGVFLHWYYMFSSKNHLDDLRRLEPSGVPGVLRNFKSSGIGMYFTPEGARLFLDLWRKMPVFSGENVLASSILDTSKFYACDPAPLLPTGKILPSYLVNQNPLLTKDH